MTRTPADSGRLGPQERIEAWRQLDGGYVDVLVVGGGVTGSGVALDAATRGLSVALVEARDLASGTSSRSSKLFHGGLRYLEKLDLGLVREALRERELMLTRIAPHLVRPVAFLYPLRHRFWERVYVGAGLALYDRLGGRSSVPRACHLSRRAALQLFPGLRGDALVGAVCYYDAQADDARHTMVLARTAAAHGAIVRTSTEVVELVREEGRVVGALLRGTETGETVSVRAGVVVGCTGVWTEDLQALTGAPGDLQVRASKGVHLLVPGECIDAGSGLILRTETSVLFVIPWGDKWIVGTTDTDWSQGRSHPVATSTDVDYILARVNAVLRRPLTRDDILGVYAGLRPLISGATSHTAQLSREHAIGRSMPGLVTVAGGKYTTYRVMARDAVDAAAEQLDRPVGPSVTEQVPLVGAAGYADLLARSTELAAELGVTGEQLERLLGRYGSLVHEVFAPALEDPSLRGTVPGAPEHLLAELRYAASHEGARHLDDLLGRRTRVSIETRHRGAESAEAVARVVAPVLGWDEDDVQREVATWTARVLADRAAMDETGDEAASEARSRASELRAVGRPVS